jgi:hypothetical protein
MKTADPKAAAGRAFVRSLNILLKFARLYGYDHVRTAEQLQIAWEELREAIPDGTESGLLLGASGAQLLLDGVPLEGAPAEKQFAQLLSTAGLASIQFYPCITEKELGSFAHAFPTGKSKPSELAQQLKDALADARGIRVNEVCFVATDSRLTDTSLAAQLAAAALGEEQDQFRKMLNDPQKLLELIAAAEGRKSGSDTASFTAGFDGSGAGGSGSGNGNGTGSGGDFAGGNGIGAMNGLTGGLGSTMGSAAEPGYGPGGGSGRGGTGSGEPSEEEIYGILRALSTFGKMGTTQNPTAAALEFQGQVTQMPSRAHDTLRNALAGLAEEGKNKKLDQAVLVQLAEHLSIRFALEKFESGEVKVNAVRQMLDRMNHQIEELRKILGQHEAERCRILLSLLDHVDPLVMPLVVDEVGMTGDRETLGRLLTLADGDLPAGSSQFLRVKAIEALGRLEAPESLSALKRILESRKVFRWAHAQELRIAALQVLEKMDPDWAKEYLPVTGIEHNDLGLTPLDTQRNSIFVRQRRHTRVRLHRTVSAVSTNLKQNCRFQIKTVSLNGGLASTNMHLAPGTQVQLRMRLGLRNLQATALMRDYRAQDMAFEIVDMGLEERTKLRQLLLESMVKSGAAGN